MELERIGNFIKELRKEKGITQEELSEEFYVSRRTVSRWETGANLPDIDILIELSDYFNVDLREILNGKRKEELKMKDELRETAVDVNEYNKTKFKRTRVITLVFLIFGLLALSVGLVLLFLDLPDNFWIGFLKGALIGTALSAILIAILYVTGIFNKFARIKYDAFHNN